MSSEIGYKVNSFVYKSRRQIGNCIQTSFSELVAQSSHYCIGETSYRSGVFLAVSDHFAPSQFAPTPIYIIPRSFVHFQAKLG